MPPADKPVASHATSDITTPGATGTASAATSEAVKEAPARAPDSDPIKLPPSQPRPDVPARPSLAVRFFDAVNVVLLLAAAVFLAAFPVRNSDVLMHLATGRAIVDGSYSPLKQADPFSHTTEGVRWVNHSWLTDLTTYGVYKIVGLAVPKGNDPVETEQRQLDATIVTLAVLKAILIALLALVLLRVGWGGGSLPVPILCVSVALMTMAPRLLLQPIVVSFLFLGMTLWLLQRGGNWLAEEQGDPSRRKPAAGDPVSWKNYWPLLPLFALWANLDEWFILGPITVGLYALGQGLQGKLTERKPTGETPRPGEVRALGVIFLAGLAACLLNPHHVYVFTLPDVLGLSQVASILSKDHYLRNAFTSPFDKLFDSINLSATRLAYLPLIGFGVLSFAVNYNRLRWWRLLTFAFFLLLSARTTRAVPFFAVVAGPIMALNFHDLALTLRIAPAGRPQRRERAAGRVLLALGLVALLIVCWPGLAQQAQGRPERRFVSFANELDPSLEIFARWVKDQHEQRKVPSDSRVFNLSPDTGNALAWYCPEVKGFFDHRFSLFGAVAQDIVSVRAVLLESDDKKDENAPVGDWQVLLERHAIDQVFLYPSSAEGAPQQGFAILSREPPTRQEKDWVRQEKDWVLLDGSVDGRSAAFGWARKQPAYRQQAANPERNAYSPSRVRPAPESGMPYLPAPEVFLADPLNLWRNRPKPHPLGGNEAALHLLRFKLELEANQNRLIEPFQMALALGTLSELRVGPVPLTGTVLPTAVIGNIFQGLLTQQARTLEALRVKTMFDQFRNGYDAASPAHLYLAVRAARRALAENPDDPYAHYQLGEAYFLLARTTRERAWSRDQPLLRDLRTVQTLACYNQAVILKEDFRLAHLKLALLYRFDAEGQPIPHFSSDMYLHHLRTYLNYAKAQIKDKATEEYRSLPEVEKEVEKFDKFVSRNLASFENRKQVQRRVLDQAREAFVQMHLGRTALQILRDSELAVFGPEGMHMQIELALHMGMVREVSTWFDVDEEQEKNFIQKLGRERFHRIKGLLAAAVGDYAAAESHFGALDEAQVDTSNLRVLLASLGVVDIRTNLPSVLSLQQGIALCLSREVLDASSPALVKDVGTRGMLLLRQLDIQYAIDRINQHLNVHRQRSQYTIVRAMLALEMGDISHAKALFRNSLGIWKPLPDKPSVRGIDFPGRVMAEAWLEELEKYDK